MKKKIDLKVNGEKCLVEVDPHMTLLEVIRDELGLTGAKLGCGGGECGACTVIFNGMSVKACLFLALDAAEGEVWTIEGLAKEGNLHPLQQAFVEHGAIQCGFCTPGMIMASKALLDENSHLAEQQLKNGLVGNLCRCTGYTNIFQAILSVTNIDEKL